MNKVFKAVLDYIKDWKNLLLHSIIGVGLLLIALFLPVNVHIRIGILLCVVLFNIVRMRLEKKKQEKTLLKDELHNKNT